MGRYKRVCFEVSHGPIATANSLLATCHCPLANAQVRDGGKDRDRGPLLRLGIGARLRIGDTAQCTLGTGDKRAGCRSSLQLVKFESQNLK